MLIDSFQNGIGQKELKKLMKFIAALNFTNAPHLHATIFNTYIKIKLYTEDINCNVIFGLYDKEGNEQRYYGYFFNYFVINVDNTKVGTTQYRAPEQESQPKTVLSLCFL